MPGFILAYGWILGHTPSLREVKTDIQDRKLEAGTETEATEE